MKTKPEARRDTSDRKERLGYVDMVVNIELIYNLDYVFSAFFQLRRYNVFTRCGFRFFTLMQS